MKITIVLLITGLTSVLGECISEKNAVDNDEDIEKNINSFQRGNLDFALEMFRDLHFQKNNGTRNLFFSPLSVWTALLPIYIGSNGQTSKELGNVLGIDNLNKFHLSKSLSAFLNFCESCEKIEQSSFTIANRVYLQEDLILKLCQEQFGDSLARIDFNSNPEEARNQINKWVEKQTNGKIQDLIPSSSIDSLTQLVIANAVYFKEMWKIQFDPKFTRPRRFHQNRDKLAIVDMMNSNGFYLYGVSDEMNCQALEIPYADNELSMIILLPQHPYLGLDILARSVTPNRLRELFNLMSLRDVLVSLPKFKVEEQYELSNVLQKMGLRSLFDPRFADLSGFTGSKDLTVDAVYHKSFIKVNEEGTEAAAATSIVSSRVARPVGVTSFIADRPFLYFIRHIGSGTILFMGTVKSPQYE